MNNMYNSYFFNEFYQENGGGNYTDQKRWMPFFEMIADKIIEIFNPKTVLDAGCACGYLVSALRDRGVEAYGMDISEYAINNAREDIKPYLNVQSITEKLPKNFPEKFDLVVTIEVLEHLFPEDGRKAIELLCSYSDTVIFTSTPTDIEDKTHVNVQQREYWAKIFAEQSFYRDLYQPVDFICEWAMLFRKRDDISKVIFEYELSDRVDAIKTKKELFKCYYKVEEMDSYSEECCKAIYYHHEQECIEVEIQEEKTIVGLRIDPMECNCIIKHFHVFDLLDDRNELSIKTSNGIASGSRWIFENDDPMLEIEVPQNEETIKLEVVFEIEYADSQHISDTYHMLSGERKEVSQVREKQIAMKNELNAEILKLTHIRTELESKKEQLISTIVNQTERLEALDNAIQEQKNVFMEFMEKMQEEQKLFSEMNKIRSYRISKSVEKSNWRTGGRK